MHRTEGHPSLNQGGVSDRKGKVVKRTDATWHVDVMKRSYIV